MRQLGLELKFAWRRARASFGSTATMVVVLALGVGANVAVFGVLDPLLLGPLPVRAPSELTLVHSVGTLGENDIAEAATFEVDRNRRDLFADVAWDEGTLDQRVTRDGTATTVRTDAVSTNYFSLLSLPAAAGSLLPTGVTLQGAVLDYQYWQRAFGGDLSVVGRSISIRNQLVTIIGVAPPDFFGLTVGDRVDLYVVGGPSIPNWIRIIARLRPDRSAESAQAGLTAGFNVSAGRSLPEIERQQHMLRPIVTPIPRGLSDRRDPLVRPAWALMAMVALLLAIATSNVANVLMARHADRRAETAIQIALGAGPATFVGASIFDGLLVAAGGLVIGFAAGRVASVGLAHALAATYGVSVSGGFSVRLFVLLLSGAALTILIAGGVPAMAATRLEVVEGLRRGAGSVGHTRRQRRLRQGFVAAQVGASITLVATAALFVHSLTNLEAADTGFDADRVAMVALSTAGSRTPVESAAAVDRLVSVAQGIPGVESVALSTVAPFSGDMIGINVTSDVNASGETTRAVKAFFTSVTPAYFDTLGIPVEAGREFTWADDTPADPSIVLNAVIARELFGGASPLGRRVKFVEGRRPPMTVVGVVSTSRYLNLREAPTNFVYTLRPRVPPPALRSTMLIRGPRGVIDTIEPSLRRLGGPAGVTDPTSPGVAVGAVTTLRGAVDRTLRVDRAIAWLCSVVGALALAVVAIGLYGVVAVVVAERTREIGLRMALGAKSSDIVVLMSRACAGLIGGGLVLGGAGATLARALVAAELFGVPRFDLAAAVAVGGLVVGVAMAAFAVPVRRAMRVDPAVVLRRE